MFKIYENDGDLQKKASRDKCFSIRDVVSYRLKKDRDYTSSAQFNIYKIEDIYLKSDKKIVYIDDDGINALLRTKFNVKHLSSLFSLNGASCFMVSPKTTYAFNGVRIRPMIAVVDTYVGFRNAIDDVIEDLIPGIEVVHNEYSNLDDVLVNVSVNCKDELNSYISVSEKGIVKIMKTSVNDFFDREKVLKILDYISGNSQDVSIVSYQEQVAILLSLRLAVAIYLFSSITKGEYFFSLCKKSHKSSIKKIKNADDFYFSELRVPDRYFDGSISFRQLTSERYYKNEYDGIDAGTRWVEVQSVKI